MKFAWILAAGMWACTMAAALGQTTSAPATAPTTTAGPATTAASQPARFKTRVDGKQVIIDIPETGFRLTVNKPEFWSVREGSATLSPLLYRNMVKGMATVGWSFTMRPMEKNATGDEAIQQLITRYTVHLDNFAIKDTGTLEAADGRKLSYILYTTGGVSPEDQRYYREILVPISEKRMLVILELCNTEDWGVGRPEVQGVTRSLRLEKVSKP